MSVGNCGDCSRVAGEKGTKKGLPGRMRIWEGFVGWKSPEHIWGLGRRRKSYNRGRSWRPRRDGVIDGGSRVGGPAHNWKGGLSDRRGTVLSL